MGFEVVTTSSGSEDTSSSLSNGDSWVELSTVPVSVEVSLLSSVLFLQDIKQQEIISANMVTISTAGSIFFILFFLSFTLFY